MSVTDQGWNSEMKECKKSWLRLDLPVMAGKRAGQDREKEREANARNQGYCGHLKTWHVRSPVEASDALKACVSLYLKIIIPLNNDLITTQPMHHASLMKVF